MFSLRALLNCTKSTLICTRHVSGASNPFVDVKVDNAGVGVLTLQRLPVNSLNLELLTELANALEEAEKSKYKGIVLTSGYSSIFTAGMDIKEVYKPQVSRLQELWKTMRRVSYQLLTSSYVSTTAITGHTFAAGCILAISTEYRVMVDGPSFITLNDTELGINVPPWVVAAMMHVMGGRQAEIALTTSAKFSPQEAKNSVLIDDVAINKEDSIEKCKEFINKSDNVVPFARKKTKERIRKSIIDIWTEDYKPESLQEYIKEVTNPERQKALEMYLEQMKNNKKRKE